jgi:sulfite exporter TauE/SafE
MEVWTGFILGFFGSLHCIGMCGPIVLALPSASGSGFSFVYARVLYNLGRVVTYTLLGLIFGLLGSKIYMFGLQQVVSIVLGAVIILWIAVPARLKNKFRRVSGFNLLTEKLKNLFIPFFKRRSNVSMLSIGVLNGFLPCGFVYIGIAGAMAVSSAGSINGMLFMALFGVGTIPAMLGTSIAGNYVNIGIKRKFAKLVPVFAVLLAAIFILRGLNLGIPYLSPKYKMKPQTSSIENVQLAK